LLQAGIGQVLDPLPDEAASPAGGVLFLVPQVYPDYVPGESGKNGLVTVARNTCVLDPLRDDPERVIPGVGGLDIGVRIGVKDNAEHLGGINIFGRGFGNYDQDLVLRLYFS
jgi:hypothetical protein